MPDKRNPESNQRCKRCGLSAADVPYPENFWIKEGLCNICLMEKYQVIPDYRSDLQKHLDELERR